MLPFASFLPSSIDRRGALHLLGLGAGAAVASTRTRSASAAPLPEGAQLAPDCVLSPTLTEGPFFVDERLNRVDLTTNTANTNVTNGVPLTLTIGLVSTTGSCAPLHGLHVDVWHADAAGKYSDVASEGTAGQTFLRGYQVSDASGLVTFRTIFPGWYSGRTIHIHLLVRRFDTAGNQTYRWASQLFFDPATTLTVTARAPYNTRGTSPDTTNAQDGIYQQSGGSTLLAMSGTAATGFSTALVLGIATAPTTTGPAPDAPTGLYVADVTDRDVTLRWSPPAAGATPTGYVVEGGVSPGQVLGSIASDTSAPIVRFTAPVGSFYVRVHALNGTARSTASNEVLLRVGGAAAPSAPDGLVAAVVGDTVALAWRTTASGGAPTGLVLDVAGSTAASLPLGIATSAQFPGVPAGTYDLSLRAENASGSSAASNAVRVVVPTACSGAPSTPVNFLAYRVGSTLSVTWDPAPTGVAPTSYVLTVTGAAALSIPTSARTLSGVVGAGSYTLSVSAVNACGTSPATATQTVVVP